MYSPQEPDTSQPRPEFYPPQGMYPPQPEAVPYPYPPQGAQGAYPPPPQAGPYPYPPPPQAGPYPYPPQPGMALYPYPPQNPYGQQNRTIQNRRARTAMIDGIISIVLSLLTLITLAGFAGLITGTFAIFYGFTALKVAKRLPGNVGRNQAITGIVLGFVAWFLVIVSFIIRSATIGS